MTTRYIVAVFIWLIMTLSLADVTWISSFDLDKITHHSPVVPFIYKLPVHHLIGCWPKSVPAQNGSFEVLQDLQFTLVCDQNYTRALGSQYVWKCTTTNLVENWEYASTSANTPLACLEIYYPAYIHLDAKVKVGLTAYDACDKKNPAMWITSILNSRQVISDLEFRMDGIPTKGCSVQFHEEGNFSKVDVYYSFKLKHRPNQKNPKRLPALLINKTRFALKKLVIGAMENLKRKKNIVSYEITELSDKFIAGPCTRPGGMVEKEESRFTTHLPVCRECPPGWYLNKQKKQCSPCGVGHFSDRPGLTECSLCPTVHPGSKSTASSKADCFAGYASAMDQSMSIKRGGLMFILANIIYVAILTFHVRNEITKILRKNPQPQTSK